jgi:hypothetical protein
VRSAPLTISIDGLTHLEDTSTYTILSKKEAWNDIRQLNFVIITWLRKYEPYKRGEKWGAPGRVIEQQQQLT